MASDSRARGAIRWLVFVGGVAIVASVAWWYRQAHDESLEIEPGGLSYHLFVPDELNRERLSAVGRVLRYERSAADGPKPTITLAHLQVAGSGTATVARITQLYTAMGFAQTASGRLVRGTTEIEISGDAACPGDCRVALAMSEHS